MDDNEEYLHVLRHTLRARDASLYASLSSEHSLTALLRSYTRRTAPHRRWLRHRELSRWLRDRPDHLSLLQERALLRLDLDLALHAHCDADRALSLIRTGGERLPSLQQTGEMVLRMQLVALCAALRMRNLSACKQQVKTLLTALSKYFALSEAVRQFIARMMRLVVIQPLDVSQLGEIVHCFVDCRNERDALPLLRVLYECVELLCLAKGTYEERFAAMSDMGKDRFDLTFDISKFRIPLQWRGDADRSPSSVAHALSLDPLSSKAKVSVVPCPERGGFKTIAKQKFPPPPPFGSEAPTPSVLADGNPVGFLTIEPRPTHCGQCDEPVTRFPAHRNRKCPGCEVAFCCERCLVGSKSLTSHDVFCGVVPWDNYMKRMKPLHLANVYNAGCSLSLKMLVTGIARGKPLSSWPQFKVLHSWADSNAPIDPSNVPTKMIEMRGEQIMRCYEIFREYCPLWASFVTLEDLVSAVMVVLVNSFETQSKYSYSLFCPTSFINHSCEPNCGIECWSTMLFAQPLRAISAGEEITITYTDPTAPVSTRREKLWEYFGFHCTCARCVRESAKKA